MTELEPNSFPRREFLRGAAFAAGAVALGLEASRAQAASHTASAKAAPSLAAAFWNGTRLVDARNLAAGDAALCESHVRLTVQRHGGGEALRALDAHYAVEIGGAAQHAPFHAWTRDAHTNVGTRFTLPVTSGAGILLSGLHDGTETFVRLRADNAAGQPKLRTGLYVLAAGQPDWAACHLDLDALTTPTGPLMRRTLSGFVPVRFGYRVVSVERA